MRRRLVAASMPAAAVGLAWSRLEVGGRGFAFAAVVALALMAALPGSLRLAVTLELVAAAVLSLLTMGAHPLGGAERGLRSFYAVALPFDGGRHREMHELALLAAFGLAAAVALTAGRRPLAGAALAAVGVCWPGTIVPGRGTVAIGVLALAAALWPPLVSRTSTARDALPGVAAAGAVVVLAAVVASSAGPSAAAVDWEHWTLFGDTSALDVRLVWDAQYDGIEFPARETTVLRISGPRRSLYWRASTLDSFAGDRWLEALATTGTAASGRPLPRDPLLPAAARSPGSWVRQNVEIAALVDDHLAGAAEPVRVDTADVDRVLSQGGGVLRAPSGLARGMRYTVWSYAPRPSPAALVRSPATYPAEVRRYLELERTTAPPFGTAGRERSVAAIFRSQLTQPLWPYEGLWLQARRLSRGTTSPYVATVAIERWLRDTGGFTYDEHPPPSVDLPPLVAFAERGKRGYCQHFAGTMALMLRLLGIPSRVAVGFTSGTWNRGTWTVTDHDAHAWVEAWFAGYGWLPFDPTPGRGTLSAAYTVASDSADAVRALGNGQFLGVGGAPLSPAGGAGVATPAESPQGTDVTWPWLLPAALGLLLTAAIAAAKTIRRRRAYAVRDPRRIAAAARAELAGFLRDQGVGVSAEAPMSELRRAAGRLGVSADAFAEAFTAARYGPPQSAAAAAVTARRELAGVLAALRERLGAGRRVRGFFALRSLRST